MFRKSNKTVLTACGLSSLTTFLQYTALVYLHKILYTRRPDSIYSLFKLPNRAAKDIITKESLKSKHTKSFFLYKILPVYNSLKYELKVLKPSKFKIKLKKTLGYEGFVK